MDRLCDGCAEYAKAGPSVLVIKTAAAGDVLRTTSLLPGIRREYPDATVTWVTLPGTAELLRGNTAIDDIVAFDAAAYPALAPRRFGLLLCLDKEPGPAGLATILNAEEKRGVKLSPEGKAIPSNPGAEFYMALGLSDDLKFRENRKTYHELIYDAVEMKYMRDEPTLRLEDVELGFARQEWLATGVDPDGPIIGINTGAGKRFPGKAMTVARTLELIDALDAHFKDETIALLGGPEEAEKNREIAERAGDRVVATNCDYSKRLFAGMISYLRLLLTGDTLAMHLAIATRTPAVGLFGPTVAQEIDFFGRGEAIVSPLDCAPCYRTECERHPMCVDAIPIEEIVKSVGKYL